MSCTPTPDQALTSQVNSYEKPAWVDNPRKEGALVGLGSARTHFKGKQAQRELATKRAIEEIARQMGVRVESQSLLVESTNSSSFEMVSLQSVDGTTVNATIKYEWYDQLNDIFYVLMEAK